MTSYCKCGGKLRRTDIVGKSVDVIINQSGKTEKRMVYGDTDPLVAHWKCERCSEDRAQRKRQPK